MRVLTPAHLGEGLVKSEPGTHGHRRRERGVSQFGADPDPHIAALGRVIREISILNNLLFGFLLVFTGANVPLDALPEFFQVLSHGLPLPHGIEAARELAGGATLGHVGGLVAAEAVVGVVYGLLGFAMLRAFEALSRRRATLELV